MKVTPWESVLYFLYINATNASYFSAGSEGFWSNNHPIAKEMKILGSELGAIISFLSQQRLIEGYDKKNQQISLTKEGLDVALENRRVEINRFFNWIITNFTVVLG
ncbi:MAG: hypothetical protein HY365_03065, partial [Candidatus Aenigmarchaeota archaeon]|nr:hypothetical protein [Candidatus Aenigmarchaeota archaeon]